MRVELHGIRKRYGKLEALAGVDLDLPSGTRVALIGPNGSGKTTLTRVVMGLIAHEGEVKLGGDRREMAYVPQTAPQMAVPVDDLISTVASVRGVPRRGIEQVAGELGLDLRAVARRPFRGLSGGMKQKLLIALALGVRPRLVVLDEPTASLDAAARGRLFELERELLAGATVILCSHRLDELRALVDRVVALEDGRVVHDGPAQTFVHMHTYSIIEVLVDASDAAWLASRGFTLGPAGWWTRVVDHSEKLTLLPALSRLKLRDLVIRDLDRLAVQTEAA